MSTAAPMALRAWAPRPGVATPVLWATIGASVATLAYTGNPLMACVPAMVVGVAILVLRLPLRIPLLALLALVAFADIVPQELPPGVDGQYTGAVHPLHELLFDNLNNVVGIAALRFSATEVIYAVLIGVMLIRLAIGSQVDRIGRVAVPSVLRVLLGLTFLAVVLMEVWGISRGGDVRQSLWQFRQLIWFPVTTVLFSYALRGEEDFRTAIRLLSIAACVKILFGIRYLAVVAWPAQMQAAMMTSHNDSLLFVVVLMAVICQLVHAPAWRTLTRAAVIGGWILLGIVLNNRRIAFVSLFGCLFMLYTMLQGPLKRSTNRLLLRAMPFLVIYLIAGRNHPNGIFKPAALVMSVTEQTDASSKTREIENTNLIHTLRQNRLLGAGWGHEYIELVQGDDISKYIAQDRYIAHNSVLWIWSIGGVIGFTCIWLPLSAAIFLARRSYNRARSSDEQTSAVLILSILVVFMVQAWGDMGTQGLSCMLMAALAVAASGKLAVATGAFPARPSRAPWQHGPAPTVVTLRTPGLSIPHVG